MALKLIEEQQKSQRQLYEEDVYKSCQSLRPEELDPALSAKGQLRMVRTIQLLKSLSLKESKVADLGCGVAPFAPYIIGKGGDVVAIDMLENPLEDVRFRFKKMCLPYVKLPEESFDGVLFTDVIADLKPQVHRLMLSELGALLKKEGWLICSSEIDLYSVDALEQLLSLIQTEFKLHAVQKSYHRLHFYCLRWLLAPTRFLRASCDAEYRLNQMMKREGVTRFWFFIHSLRWIAWMWRPVSWIAQPLKEKAARSRGFILLTEKLSKFIWGEKGITHIIVLAYKKGI
ncbi:MAG: hypothetical protein S4CHLAM123_02360 [Chlamydiales bacterium]|nr:hypothetical protein [Chlamydiales bacterium]